MSKPSVGFLLPSCRGQMALRTIEFINSIETDHPYKIFVFSPEKIEAPNTVWFKEDPPSNGACRPFDFLAVNADTDYMISVADDNHFSRNVYDSIKLLEGPEFENRKIKLASIIGTDRRPAYLPGHLNTIKVARHPVFHKSVLDYLDGHIYNHCFNQHYNDNFLAFYIEKEFGEEIYEIEDIWMETVESLSFGGQHPEDEHVFWRLVNEYQKGVTKYTHGM